MSPVMNTGVCVSRINWLARATSMSAARDRNLCWPGKRRVSAGLWKFANHASNPVARLRSRTYGICRPLPLKYGTATVRVSTATHRSLCQPIEFSLSARRIEEPGKNSMFVCRRRMASWLLCSSWNPTASAPWRPMSSAAQRARTTPGAMPLFFPLPVPNVWLLPSTLKELSVKSRIGGAADDDGGMDTSGGVDANGAVCAGATHTVDLSRGFGARADAGGTLGVCGREVGVTGEVGTARGGAGGGAMVGGAGVGGGGVGGGGGGGPPPEDGPRPGGEPRDDPHPPDDKDRGA